jgi:Na+/proline symporter/signal transduction histidine kinase
MEYLIIPIVVCYLLGLFFIAFNSEKYFSRFSNNGYFYAFSLMVYCTAWTFYGSVGWAAKDGISFLTIYIGPLLTIPFWWSLLRKMIRVTRTMRISSVADFLSVRYGKHSGLGKLVAFASLVAVVPYISLQLKAIDSTVKLLNPWAMPWASILILLLLIVFAILFGAANVDANQRKPGLISAIAFESIVKLIAFLTIGIYVVYGIFNGFGDLFQQATENLDLNRLTNIIGNRGYSDWFFMSFVSAMAFFLLPRQFQVSAVEAGKETHILTAMRVVPIYLLLINLFVLPIAIAGILLLPTADSDYYVLLLPLKEQANFLLIIGFLGGFSAATGMILVSTTALSTMLSNYIFIPFILKTEKEDATLRKDYQSKLLLWRRVSIIIIMLLSYLYYQYFAFTESLVGIGLISFIAISQLAPAFFGGLYWKKANARAAMIGISGGLMIWALFFIYPNMVHSYQIFKLSAIDWLLEHINNSLGLSPLSTGILASLSVNAMLYVAYSHTTNQSAQEVNQAELFVNIFKYAGRYDSSVARKVSAYFPDIKSLFLQFIGQKRTEALLDRYAQKNGVDWEANPTVDSKLVSYAERVLTGVIGPSSARIMVSKVVEEEEIGMDEVVNILQESQENIKLNRELKQKQYQLAKATEKLKMANDKLHEYGELKNEFLYTVTHELRTPITSIRAMAEIIQDSEEMKVEEKERFLENIIYESERMSRLISNVLDLEKFESGNQEIEREEVNLKELLLAEVKAAKTSLKEQHIEINIEISAALETVIGDEDRIRQVITNLLNNAIKYCDSEKGIIKVTAYRLKDEIKVNIANNGARLLPEDLEHLFDKFYQVKSQKNKKLVGHGLGLAISKNIIEMHGGTISADLENNWVKFMVHLPIYKKNE